ncbi:ARM repeat-containing protein [Lentinus tigrinus ALCF2SS1-6]|uniref:Deoxyhypusine hydroxylase n=1 Tax=Lentinus tigrinus ALCF2SS1-6 TaxID=1328759 RepID=A0A5C2RPK7_9APHY|nr:ARM repeat-containing protein [Lentinus tigrinus ALCF2SS1-6]
MLIDERVFTDKSEGRKDTGWTRNTSPETEAAINSSTLTVLEAPLLNASGQVPLHNRFRPLFTLTLLQNDDALKIISKGFEAKSALLKHELAYCVEQMNNTNALPILQAVLANEKEDLMVCDEAAEALGAISATSSKEVLERYLNDPERVVRETCEIALAKINWDHLEEGQKHWGALEDVSEENIAKLRNALNNKCLPVFDRYRPMFSLRNTGSAAAVDALASGFNDDSALTKHKIAFVFGQLLSTHSVPALLQVLQNSQESDMVRHDAVEALGGIVTLEMKRPDAVRIVRESCQVAIDIWEENSDQFQYANGLDSGAASEQVVGG